MGYRLVTRFSGTIRGWKESDTPSPSPLGASFGTPGDSGVPVIQSPITSLCYTGRHVASCPRNLVGSS